MRPSLAGERPTRVSIKEPFLVSWLQATTVTPPAFTAMSGARTPVGETVAADAGADAMTAPATLAAKETSRRMP
jgi:hypothetical protein